MKNYKEYIVLLALTLFTGSVNAQTLNWASLKKENKHIVSANVGLEYGVVYGLGYGFHIHTKLFPIVVNAEYSFPSGNKILGDFKTKIGAQIRVVEFHHFMFTANIHGIFRRYQNDFVRLLNFGSDMSGIIGYYRTRWFVAGEVGFDKAIVTNFKHSKIYKDQYEDVVDGWYKPATGGNFYYGAQAGFSFSRVDIWLKLGKILTQDFKTKPMVPYYGEVGVNIKF